MTGKSEHPLASGSRLVRRLTRVKSYDYASQGAYFVTICTAHRVNLFGSILQDAMVPNSYGAVVQDVWQTLQDHYPHPRSLAFSLMPNHIHGILLIEYVGEEPNTETGGSSSPHGLPEIVRAFKSFSAIRINAIRETVGRPVWQRGYYEHIIRNERSMLRIAEYVENNPAQWTLDRENLGHCGRV